MTLLPIRTITLVIAAFALACFGHIYQAHAQQVFIDWTGGAGDGLWTSAGNWSGGNIPDSTLETARFGTSFTGDQVVTIPDGSSITLADMRFGSAYNVTLNAAGSGNLTIDNSLSGRTHIIWSSGSFGPGGGTFTINTPVYNSDASTYYRNDLSNSDLIINGTLYTNGQRVIAAGSENVTINGDVTGTRGIYLERSSTTSVPVILTSVTTYTGQTEWVRGILRATGDATFGNGTGNISANFAFGANDATLELQDLNTTTIPNSYTFRGTGVNDGGALHLTSGTATFTGGGTFQDANDPQVKVVADSGTTLTLTGTTNIVGELLLEAAGDVNVSGSGRFIGSGGSIVKTGAGTLTLTGGDNTYAGATTINEGAIVLDNTGDSVDGTDLILNSGTSASMSQSDQIGASTKLTLNGATFNTGGFDEVLGALILQNSSNFDLGAGDSIIEFADSSAESWTAGQTFLLLNWSGSLSGGGTDQVFFSSGSSGLTGGQLGQVVFRDPAGLASGDYSAQILGTGEVVPVPEPSTYAMIFGLVAGGYILWMRRERKEAA